jgi:hypothetical protein
MHGCASGHLDGLQIQCPGFASTGEDHRQQLVHFLGDFLLDRFGRFVSSPVSLSSTGRRRQIWSLTASSSRLSSRNR